MLDLFSKKTSGYTQDPDLAYRPRIFHTDSHIYERGRWKTDGGECVDYVLRGCYNNGTCIAPNTCRCAAGWKGYDCTIPICEQTCHHNGNCTGPNQCTCERGWRGYDCSEPSCSQECQNGGYCIAPDVCRCAQWPNSFRDNTVGGGRPLFQKPNGDPKDTGITQFIVD